MSDQRERVRELARARGFPLLRVATATTLEPERSRYQQWIEAGRAGEMRWIDAHHAERSSDPNTVIDDPQSIISLAMPYWQGHRPSLPANHGAIARYAWGRDYHVDLGERLTALVSDLDAEFGGQYRWYVDTGPVMDKAWAARAGTGFYGKNSNILAEEFGSWVLLGEIITTLPLEPDVPLQRNCGGCRLCVVACPTGAIGPEYSIDSRRCISYLTIEHRGPIPRPLRRPMGAWAFGCDICQDVCPPTMAPYLSDDTRGRWSLGVRALLRGSESGVSVVCTGDAEAEDDSHASTPHNTEALDLIELVRMSHDRYLERFRGSSIRRAKVWMLRRNAAVALGNVGDRECLPALVDALRNDDHPVVRGHAAWALGRLSRRIDLAAAGTTLTRGLETEENGDVRAEIAAALIDDDSPLASEL